MSRCRCDWGEPLVLVSYCSASLVDWCATLPNGTLVLFSRFECHHALPKRRPPITQWLVQYPTRVLQQLTVSQCKALKNRDGHMWLKYTEGQRKHFKQGCTNSEHQVSRATKYITMVTNICGSSVWRYIQVTLLVPKTLKWLVDLQNMCASLVLKLYRSTPGCLKNVFVIFGGRTTNMCLSVWIVQSMWL